VVHVFSRKGTVEHFCALYGSEYDVMLVFSAGWNDGVPWFETTYPQRISSSL
jgi:hypothetical protein